MSNRREASVALAIVALGLVLAVAAPGFFARDNLSDLFLANLPVLIVALGMTLIILTGEIDISVGSVFAIAGVAAGLLAKAGLPMPLVALVGVPRRRSARRHQRRARRLRAHSVDCRHAGDDGGAAGRAAVGDRRRMGSGSAGELSVARADAGRLSVRGVRHRGRADGLARVGPAPSRGRPRGLRDRLEPRGGAAGRDFTPHS